MQILKAYRKLYSRFHTYFREEKVNLAHQVPLAKKATKGVMVLMDFQVVQDHQEIVDLQAWMAHLDS